MVQAAGQVVPLKLDIDKKDVGPIATKYSVSSIPALFVMDSNGKVLAAVEVTMSPKKFAADLQRIVKAHTPGGKGRPAPRAGHAPMT